MNTSTWRSSASLGRSATAGGGQTMTRNVRSGKPVPRNKENVISTLQRTMGKQKKSARKPNVHSLSYVPQVMHNYEMRLTEDQLAMLREDVLNEDFFDEAQGSSGQSKTLTRLPPKPHSYLDQVEGASNTMGRQKDTPTVLTQRRKGASPAQKQSPQRSGAGPSRRSRSSVHPSQEMPDGASPPRKRQWIEQEARDDIDGRTGDETDSTKELLLKMDNLNRHPPVARFLATFGGTSDELIALEMIHRPFFTYWVTLIQVIIFIVVMATYGIAPLGVSQTLIEDQVLMTSLAIETVSYWEGDNLWVGPRQADLIHLGAKYSLCMRPDPTLKDVQEQRRQAENDTACCINNDGSGCLQTKSDECAPSISTWFRWSSTNQGSQGRTSGSVCGQDPLYCLQPASTPPYVWNDSIVDWPLCTSTANVTTPTAANAHMTCSIIGRPCCHGIQGQCVMATREYCTFLRGYFHQDAFLCSQVNCLGEVCGMLPFTEPDTPDQFYRLFTSLCLHPGLLAMVATVLLQLTFMRTFEMIYGWWAMAIIYTAGGVAGSLASLIFIPYAVESGPSGSQLAVLGIMCVQIVRWNIDQKSDSPGPAIGKLVATFLAFIILGFIIPQVDNYAHVFGFFVGVFLAVACKPLTVIRDVPISKCACAACVIVPVAIVGGIFAMLVILFYVAPVYNCTNCPYFNCIPFTDTYCDSVFVQIAV